jgi:hypothetical protein
MPCGVDQIEFLIHTHPIKYNPMTIHVEFLIHTHPIKYNPMTIHAPF